MEIKKCAIKVKDLCEGYVNETETDIEQGVHMTVLMGSRELLVFVILLMEQQALMPLGSTKTERHIFTQLKESTLTSQNSL